MPRFQSAIAPAAITALLIATTVAWSGDRAEARTPLVSPPAPVDSALLKGYKWRNIGPDRGGRSIAVTGVRGRPNEAYFGAVGGGLWKTTDGGENWAPVTDGQIHSASVGAVAVSETNPDIVYIGMGESCIRGNIMSGDGVYKSTDGGKTWTHIGFEKSEVISKIRIHPKNPDIVFVAAFGKYSAPNEERGVYKSTDGGKTFRRVLYRNDHTAAIDLSIDRNDPNVMYAAMWEAYRKEYTMSSGGPGSGLFKSTDGGETWTEITRAKGLPQSGLVGRIGVDVSGANSNRVYALVEHDSGGLYKSDDAGASWSLVNGNRSIRQRAFYYTHVYADPKNADVVYMQNTSMFRSADGGKTTTNVGNGTHGDFHSLWIDPDAPAHLVVGNDGGGAVSTTTGEKWTDEDFPTEQFYHVITTKHIPYHVCGSQQDNSTLCTPFNWNAAAFGFAGRGGRGAGGGRGGRGAAGDITAGGMAVSYQAGGGEPGYIATDPKDPDLFYSGTNNGGFLDKFNRRLGTSREITPYPWMYSGEPSSAIRERWQWTYPIIFSPVNPDVLYASSQRLWKTTDRGNTWTAISGDLTRHDPKTMGKSGGPITGDMNGPEVYAVIFAVAPGKKDVNVIWTGSDDGLVHVTKDGGKTWANVTPKDMPDFGRVSQIDASSFNNGAAYVSVRRPLLDDKAPYIFKTTDYGKTWTKIVNGLRADAFVHAVREDPNRKGLLYAATQHGVYISYDDGAQWEPFMLNMPDVPVSDLVAEGNELVIATHGRGFWVLDNVAPLRQAKPELFAGDAYLFAPPVVIRSGPSATFSWYLKKPATAVRLEVLDSAGGLIRRLEPDTAAARGRGAGAAGAVAADAPEGFGRGRAGGPPLPNAAGLNRYSWDLRGTPAVSFPGMILWGASTNGPQAPPGRYTLRLTVDGKQFTQPMVIRRNPLIADVSDADMRAQFVMASRIRDKVSEANQAVVDIRHVKAQVTDRLKKSPDAKLKETGDKLTTDASGVEQDVYQVKNQSGQDPLNFPIRVNNRLATLLSMVERGDGRPNNNVGEILGILSTELKGYTTTLDKVWKTDLVAFNAELKRLGLTPVDPKCAKAEGCSFVP
ncbi:MAG: glycosyl hydrolase [Proteobacteria bacterium]|nr:glycosyl hydrolase [Pseudomonadota bacterium]